MKFLALIALVFGVTVGSAQAAKPNPIAHSGHVVKVHICPIAHSGNRHVT